MDSKIYLGNDLIHPETNSNVVLHNNSNLKNFLNGLVSTDNMPQFMQNFLMSADYIAANQALKTIPEIYFDYAFNKWTATGAPALSGGICSFNGSSRLQSTPGWTICGSNDFTFSCRVKPQFTNSNNPIFSAFNTSNAHSLLLNFNSTPPINSTGIITRALLPPLSNQALLLPTNGISSNFLGILPTILAAFLLTVVLSPLNRAPTSL